MRAIAEACASGEIAATAPVIVSPVMDSPAAMWAVQNGLSLQVVSPKADHYGPRLLDTLRNHRADWVCLAGYTRLLPMEVLAAFPNRILNIHPALLPKFGGKGMYGMRVHEAVLAAGETESGCSVHLVTENYDEGPIVLQFRCPVEQSDTAETLAARVLELEKLAYKAALKKVLEFNEC